MKFIDKFLEKKKGKIVFSVDETIIYEEENIFQTIENTGENTLKYLNLYIKKLKGFSGTDIFINEGYFKIFETEAENDEVSEKDRDRFIEYETKVFLNEDNLDEYFIKYFSEKNKKFIVYILDREFVENLVEFLLNNRIKVGRIILSMENSYFIDDYDSLLKKDMGVPLDKKGLTVIFIMALIFLGIYFYGKHIDKKITEADKKIILAEEELNYLKEEEDSLNIEIEEIKEEKEKLFDEGLLFSEKIFRILKIMPEEIKVEKIYYEKGHLNIKGRVFYEPLLFDFSEILEKEDYIFSVKYDYIIKKENSFEFLLELRV